MIHKFMIWDGSLLYPPRTLCRDFSCPENVDPIFIPYINVNDKHDEELYLWDIVQDINKEKYLIIFVGGSFVLSPLPHQSMIFTIGSKGPIEKLGNKVVNPELMS